MHDFFVHTFIIRVITDSEKIVFNCVVYHKHDVQDGAKQDM